MPNKNTQTLWTLRESKKQGMTTELISAFRDRASREGLETIEALVRVMRQFIERGLEATSPKTPAHATQVPPDREQPTTGKVHVVKVEPPA